MWLCSRELSGTLSFIVSRPWDAVALLLAGGFLAFLYNLSHFALIRASSALSAARAITNHVHDWIVGTPAGEYVSMAVYTDGTDGYGVAPGLIYSFPVICRGGGNWEIVKGLPVDEFSKQKMKATEAELIEERDIAFSITG